MTNETTAPAAADVAPDTLTINLRKPVRLGDLTYDKLELREPSAAEWMQWDRLEGVEADVKAIALISGVPEPAVRMIGVRDIVVAARFVSGFLSQPHLSGAQS